MIDPHFVNVSKFIFNPRQLTSLLILSQKFHFPNSDVNNLILFFIFAFILKNSYSLQIHIFFLPFFAKLLNAKILIKLNLSCLRPSRSTLNIATWVHDWKAFDCKAFLQKRHIHNARIRIMWKTSSRFKSLLHFQHMSMSTARAHNAWAHLQRHLKKYIRRLDCDLLKTIDTCLRATTPPMTLVKFFNLN